MRATTKKRLIALSAALVAVGLASDAAAQNDDLLVEMRMGANVAEDPSYDVLDDGDIISTYKLGVGTAVGPMLPGLRLYLEYEVNLPGSQPVSRFGDAAEIAWRRHRFLALADWGWHVLPWLRPAARLGAGYSVQYLSASFGGQPELEDFAHDLVVQGSGAAEAAWDLGDIGGTLVTLSLMGEVGYQLQTDATFDELEFDDEAFDESDPWRRSTVALGSLNTNGLFWNLGVGLRLAF